MPQLNLAWWLFNFILGWISLIAVLIILLNTNMTTNTTNLNTTTYNSPNPAWTWN